MDGDEVALGLVGAKTGELRYLAGTADAQGAASRRQDQSGQEQALRNINMYSFAHVVHHLENEFI